MRTYQFQGGDEWLLCLLMCHLIIFIYSTNIVHKTHCVRHNVSGGNARHKRPRSLRSVRWSQPGRSWGGFMWKVVLELVLGWLKCWQARAGWTAWDFQSLNENEWWNSLDDFCTYSLFRHSVNDYKCMISSTLQITELSWSRDCNLQLIDEEPLA